MKRLTTSLLAITALFTAASSWASSDVLNSETGIVQVIVEDSEGRTLAGAPVFISDGEKTRYVDSDSMGMVSLNLQEGEYRITSAMMQAHNDGFDRFASREAVIRVVPMDTVSVVLMLHPVQDPIADLSLSTLKKIGVADEVAKYLN